MWHLVWTYASAAALLGWATTALFCAVAGTALALWARLPWVVGFVIGLVTLGVGVLLLAVVGGVRAAGRRSVSAAAAGPSGSVPAGSPGVVAGGEWYRPGAGAPGGPARPTVVDARSGVRARARHHYRRWTRTPSTRAEIGLAVACLATSVLLLATIGVGWVRIVGPTGTTLYAAGPFEIQLGLFVVLSAVVVLASGVGLLRWRSGWWPVLCAWCATWWAFLAIAALSVRSELGQLSRLLDDTVTEHVHVRQRLGIGLGSGWTFVLALSVVTLLLCVGMLALQARDARRAGA